MNGTTATLRRVLPGNEDCLGILKAPGGGNAIASIVATGLPWGIDNGAFSGFDPLAFQRLIDGARGSPGLLWVACPDVVADAEATLRQFEEWAPRLEGLPVAFVGQDGLKASQVPWERFACLFLGGSTEWKLGDDAADLAAEAKAREKWLHMGRVNSLRRLWHARSIGCDSVDGTGMSRWGDVHLAKFCKWAREVETALY